MIFMRADMAEMVVALAKSNLRKIPEEQSKKTLFYISIKAHSTMYVGESYEMRYSTVEHFVIRSNALNAWHCLDVWHCSDKLPTIVLNPFFQNFDWKKLEVKKDFGGILEQWVLDARQHFVEQVSLNGPMSAMARELNFEVPLPKALEHDSFIHSMMLLADAEIAEDGKIVSAKVSEDIRFF